jgi:hypothetical protein
VPEIYKCSFTNVLPPLALTSPSVLSGSTGHPKKVFQITLCPWFLDYAMRKKFQFTNSLSGTAKRFYARYFLVPVMRFILFKKIDMISLFDKTILHEVSTETIRRPQ